MKDYVAVPVGLVDGWQESVRILPAGYTLDLQAEYAPDFHYHNVDEWLTVVSGEITFFTLADRPFRVDAGRALHIPSGEVHRVEVGSQEVEYRMFLPTAVPTSAFVNRLKYYELDALRNNLKFPEYEDGRTEDGAEFFKSILSDQLVFCRANGKCDNKEEFLAPFGAGPIEDKSRSSSGSIQILNKADNGGLLISTIVQMGEAEQAEWYMNVRFLEKDDEEKLRCRLWVNYPQSVPS